MMILFSIGVPLVFMVSSYTHSLSHSSMTVSRLLSLLLNIIFSVAFQVAYECAPLYQRLNDCFSSPLRLESLRMHVYLAFLLRVDNCLGTQPTIARLQAIRTHKLLLLLILYPSLTLYVVFDVLQNIRFLCVVLSEDLAMHMPSSIPDFDNTL